MQIRGAAVYRFEEPFQEEIGASLAFKELHHVAIDSLVGDSGWIVTA